MIELIKSRMLAKLNYNKKSLMKGVKKEMAYIIVLSLLLVSSVALLVVAGKHIVNNDPA